MFENRRWPQRFWIALAKWSPGSTTLSPTARPERDSSNDLSRNSVPVTVISAISNCCGLLRVKGEMSVAGLPGGGGGKVSLCWARTDIPALQHKSTASRLLGNNFFILLYLFACFAESTFSGLII